MSTHAPEIVGVIKHRPPDYIKPLADIKSELKHIRTAIYATAAKADDAPLFPGAFEHACDTQLQEQAAKWKRKARKWKRRAQEWQSPTIEALKVQRNDIWDVAKSNYDRAEKAEAELARIRSVHDCRLAQNALTRVQELADSWTARFEENDYRPGIQLDHAARQLRFALAGIEQVGETKKWEASE